MKKIIFLVAFLATTITSMAQFSNGSFLLTEGQYGSSSGGLFWLDPETGSLGSSVSQEVNGAGYGETSQFATIYGDKLYVTSKQAGSYGGGLLTVADAATAKNIYIFSSMSNDGHNYDGRAFCGVTESKGYMGTSNGIFVIDLEDNQVVKLIEGSDCGYGIGEAIDGGYYQYDVYYHQIGSMVRVGDCVFASKQNEGILVIDIATDEIIYTISAEEFGGSFGELIQSKDGMLWTTACSTENYSYDHTPELNKLVMIDPYTCEAIEIPTEHKVSVSWATWRHGMMQACEHSNKILWKDVCYFDWMMYEQVGAPQILYYDIETGEEGVFVDLTTINPDYSIYAGFSVDPETDNVYVPVASNSGYGPWFLLVFDPQGTLIVDPISIPIGDWSDYPSMTLFTDDYTPEFTLDDKYILDVNDKIEFNLADIVFDKDNTQNGIIVDILNVENPEIATAEIADNKLTLWMKGQGLTTITLKALSNGKSTTKTITLSESGTTGIESVGMFNSQLFYRNGSLNVINSAGSYVTIYNTSGNQLYKHQINSNNFSMPLNLSPGIYIATVNGNTLKIAIQ